MISRLWSFTLRRFVRGAERGELAMMMTANVKLPV